MTKKSHRKDTVIAHTAMKPMDNQGIPNPPVYYASTVLFPTIEDFETRDKPPFAGVQYGRSGTPTQFALEEAVTSLYEGAHKTVSFPSGLGAIAAATITFLRHGDHILVSDSVYAPTRKRVGANLLERAGVEITYYDPLIGAGIEDLIQPNTRMIYMESPGSHTFDIQDVPAITKVARAREILTAIDNTWSSPYFCNPFALGVDIVIEAGTKYLCGHSDAMLGTVSLATEELFQAVKGMQNTLGSRSGPDECYLALRGIRTLSVRMERHQKNAMEVATWLQARPEVERVLYPALPDDPGHELWKRDHTGASGLFGVMLGDYPKAAVSAMVDGLDLFGIGASWGGFESLAIPANPAGSRTAVPWPPKGTPDNPMVRLHIGLEDPRDLIEDLEEGFARLNAAK
ncbi:MAG: cystathionine beta-lyase [Rhodospirillales bacterium]